MRDLTASQRGGHVFGIVGKALAYVVMGTFALMTTFPIIWLILNSFKSTQEYLVNSIGLPRAWTTVNYPEAWRIGDFGNLVRHARPAGPRSRGHPRGRGRGLILLPR